MADVVLEGCTYERPRSAAYVVGIDNVGMIKRVHPTHQRPILWYYKAVYAISWWNSWCWCSMSSYFIEGWPRGWKIAHSDISQDTSLWSVVMPVLSIPVDRAWVIVYSTAVSSLYSLFRCRSKSRSGTGFHHGGGSSCVMWIFFVKNFVLSRILATQ